jgi:hypothetical protein
MTTAIIVIIITAAIINKVGEEEPVLVADSILK